MVKCSAYRCDSASYHKTPGLTFHRFPKDVCVQNAWIDNTKLQDWQPTRSSVLCSKHFENHLIDPSAFRTTLRPGAIPTLFNELPVAPYEKENIINPPQKTLPRKRTADMSNVSVLKEIQNKIKPVVSTSNTTETALIIQDEENVPGPSNYNIVIPSKPPVPVSTGCQEVQILKRKIILKNKKIKALLQQRRRLKKKVSQFSTTDAIHIVNNSTPTFEKNIMEIHDIDEDLIDFFLDDVINTPLDEYTREITIYIAGFIARKIHKKINCSLCQMLMIGEKENFLFSLIKLKDRGGLTYPSQALIKVIQICEKCFKIYKSNEFNSLMKFVADYVDHSIFDSNDPEHDRNHVHLLIKIIVKFYIDLRCKHECKETNWSQRNHLKKIVLFQNK